MNTKPMNYFNSQTGESSWSRPAALGAAGVARRQAGIDPPRLQRAEGS